MQKEREARRSKRERREAGLENKNREARGCNIVFVILKEMFSFCSRVLSNISGPKNMSKPIPSHNWHIGSLQIV